MSSCPKTGKEPEFQPSASGSRPEATLHAKLISVNPKLYVNAKQEFDRLRKYHFVPSNSSRSSNLVVAPKGASLRPPLWKLHTY